jgi:hypothetical protein
MNISLFLADDEFPEWCILGKPEGIGGELRTEN